MGVWLERDRPFRLAFRAREVVGGGWKENGPPSVSRFERGWGMEVVGKETALRLAFRGNRGGWNLQDPSISRFERGSGLEVVGRKMVPLCLAL